MSTRSCVLGLQSSLHSPLEIQLPARGDNHGRVPRSVCSHCGVVVLLAEANLGNREVCHVSDTIYRQILFPCEDSEGTEDVLAAHGICRDTHAQLIRSSCADSRTETLKHLATNHHAYVARTKQTHTHTQVSTYVHMYTRTDTRTCIRTSIHTYLPTYLPTYLLAYLPTCLLTYIHTYKHTYIRTYTHGMAGHGRAWPGMTYIHAQLALYLHTYAHTYIHSFIHAHLRTYIHT